MKQALYSPAEKEILYPIVTDTSPPSVNPAQSLLYVAQEGLTAYAPLETGVLSHELGHAAGAKMAQMQGYNASVDWSASNPAGDLPLGELAEKAGIFPDGNDDFVYLSLFRTLPAIKR